MPPVNDQQRPDASADPAAAISGSLARARRKPQPGVTPPAVSLRAFLRDAREQGLAFLFGDDIFISYARADATAYAAALASRLTRRKLSCYLDQWSTRPDAELPADLRVAIRRSGVFLLLATDAAMRSEFVAREIAEFIETRRPFPLVQLGGDIQSAAWSNVVTGAARTIDVDGHAHATPSREVVNRIVNSFDARTRNQRIARAFWAVLFGTIVVAVGGAVGSFRVVSSRDEAIHERAVAVAERNRADREKVDAEKASALARRAATDAARQAAESESAFRVTQQAAEALSLYAEEPRQALRMAAEGLATLDTPPARAAVLSLLARDRRLVRFVSAPDDPGRSEVDALEIAEGATPRVFAIDRRRLSAWALTGTNERQSFLNADPIGAVAASETLVAIASQGPRAEAPYVSLLTGDLRRVVRRFPTKVKYVNRLRFLGKNRLLGFASFEGVVSWDITTGQEDTVLEWSGLSSEFAVSPDGRSLAVTNPSGVGASSRRAGERFGVTLLTRPGDDGPWKSASAFQGLQPTHLAFPSNDRLVMATAYNAVHERVVETGQEQELRVTIPESGDIRALQGVSMAVDTAEAIRIVPLYRRGQQPLWRSTRIPGVQTIAFSPSGRFVAGRAGPGYLGLWDLERGPDLGFTRARASPPDVVSVAEGATPGSLAVVQRAGDVNVLHTVCDDKRDRVVIRRLSLYASIARLDPPVEGQPCRLSWRVTGINEYDGDLWMATIRDRHVEYAQLQDGLTVGGRPSLSSDGRRIAHCGAGFTLLDVSDPRAPRAMWRGARVECRFSSVSAFSPDGRYLAVATGLGDRIDILDVARGVTVGSATEGDLDTITALAFSADGTSLAVGLQSSRVQVWSIDPGDARRVRRLTPPDSVMLDDNDAGVYSLLFTRDGHLYASNLSLYVTRFSPAAWIAMVLERAGGAKPQR